MPHTNRTSRNSTPEKLDRLADQEFECFPWHKYADMPHSSQTFCVNAFGSFRQLRCRDRAVSDMLSRSFSDIPGDLEEWCIELEYEDPTLLNELGTAQPSSIDVLCRSRDTVICVESKFVTDAREGFGGCRQAQIRQCAGFYGPGSDLKPETRRANANTGCRLEAPEGRRTARSYWRNGREFFRPQVFRFQSPDKTCPFRGSSYQLMRNFLFGAAFARQNGQRRFGVMTISPAGNAGRLVEQVEQFRSTVLLPELRESVQAVTYERLIGILDASRDPAAVSLASFLKERIEALVPGATDSVDPA